jgi:hypothetical protein
MVMIVTSKQNTIDYPSQTIARADRALACSPFYLLLFLTMSQNSVAVPLIAGVSGVEKGYTKQNISETKADSELSWLIDVGLLRREVDGQGLTDSFRLTPLGKYSVEKWQKQGGSFPQPSWFDRLQNFLRRWLRLPF